MADRPLPGALTPCHCRLGADAELAVTVAGTRSPHHKLTLYFGGLLIKIEQLAGLRNCTLGQCSSLDSNCRDAKCYRIGAMRGAARFWDDRGPEFGIAAAGLASSGTLGPMHTYKLMRQGGLVQVFVDGQSSGKTLSANQRNELRDFMASFGLAQADIDFKVHELYLTNATSFTAS
jgi:hypothetical protein